MGERRARIKQVKPQVAILECELRRHVSINVLDNLDAGYKSLAFKQAYSPIIVTLTLSVFQTLLNNIALS